MQGVLVSVTAVVYTRIIVSDRIGSCPYRPFSNLYMKKGQRNTPVRASTNTAYKQQTTRSRVARCGQKNDVHRNSII